MAFRFILDPQANAPRLEEVVVNGDELTVNGRTFNFRLLEEGETIPANAVDCPNIAHRHHETITRENGYVVIRLLYPYKPPAPVTTRFPDPVDVTTNGRVNLPAYTQSEVWE